MGKSKIHLLGETTKSLISLFKKRLEMFHQTSCQFRVYGKYITEKVFGAGLGVGIGWKYVTKNNWVGELYLNISKDFLDNVIEGVVPRAGLSIGKRF